MSTSLSQCLRQRQCNKYNTSRSNLNNKFSRQVYGDPFFLNRLVFDKRLESPSGGSCARSISSLSWSEQGDNLLSGSRSGQICVWHPFDSTESPSGTITTDEHACIHSVSYLSTNRITCGSETGTIWLYDLNTCKPIKSYACSTSSTRIEIDDNNHEEVVSCSEDGTIRHFDLRQHHICDRTPQCSCVIFDLNRQVEPVDDPIRLQSVSINTFAPSYLAVAGSQNYAYLHDRRMMGPTGKSLVKLFGNRNAVKGERQNELCYSNTCKFSKSHSDMLMVSWSDDDIYLFNIYDDATTTTTLSRREHAMDAGVVQHRYRYTGHLNPWVNCECIGFYGLDDEYIISGTDDGMVFIWDRRNEKVVQMLRVNHSPINVVKGHPYLPMMAIAGSDPCIKLYAPRSEPLMTSSTTHPFAETSYATESHMFEVNDLIKRNEELKHGHPSHLFDYLIQNDSGPPPCYLQ